MATSGAVLPSTMADSNASLDNYPIPLSEWLIVSQQTAKGKSRKPCYVYFVLHRIEELVRLTREANTCEVMPTESTAHIIFEPRIREIVCAAAYKRVLQTFYIRNLQPYLELYLYHPDSYSCRRGKGGLRAVETLQDYIFTESNGYTSDLWLAKVDIKAFFMSIDCFKACEVVEEFVKTHMADHPHRDFLLYVTRTTYLSAAQDHIKDMAHPWERALLDPAKSMSNHPYYQGVPIGDWTSQTIGLVLTTYALRYLESLGYKFVHYTDDTVVLVRDKQKWLEDVQRLEWFYREHLGLELHPNKRYLQHYSKGVEALGYKVRYDRILPSDRIYHNMTWYIERTIRRAEEKEGYVLAYAEKIQAVVNSYLSHLRWCNACRLRKEVCERVEGSVLGSVLVPSGDYKKVTIRPKYTKTSMYHRNYKELKKYLKTTLL